jgi:YfiH family protein
MPPEPSGGFVWVQAVTGPALVCQPLAEVARHIFTTRMWRLGSPDTSGAVEGWAEVATTLGVEPQNLVRVHQVHGSAVVVARVANQGSLPRADIIVSAEAAVAIAVQVADCVPLLIADRRTGVVASAHAGWRGLAARVPEVAVHALVREFNSRPADMIAAVGPSIGACCYEVGADVRDAFGRAKWDDDDVRRWFVDGPQPTALNPSMLGPAAPRADHWFMDGWAIARAQLQRAGVPTDQIYTAALCTASHPTMFCSYRRDGKGVGRLAAAIIATRR